MKEQIIKYLCDLSLTDYSLIFFKKELNVFFLYEYGYSKINIENCVNDLINDNYINLITFENFQIVSTNTKKMNRIRKLYKIKNPD